jgi:hypothetical protein
MLSYVMVITSHCVNEVAILCLLAYIWRYRDRDDTLGYHGILEITVLGMNKILHFMLSTWSSCLFGYVEYA